MIDYNKWSRQALFNKIARHLLKQGKRSKYNSMMDKEGCRCAMGCLISKKDYVWSDTWKGFIQPYWPIRHSSENYELASKLRRLHDYGPKPSQWPGALRKIARYYDLEIPEFLKEMK